MIDSNSLLNVDYDIIKYGRYENNTRQLLTQLQNYHTKEEQELFARQYGFIINSAQPFLSLSFDRHIQIPVDPAHCLCQGLDAVLIDATISLLSVTGKNTFSSLIRQLELPRNWRRFQDPVQHLRSYFFSDLARLIMVGPFVLIQLSENDFSQQLQPLRLKLGHRIFFTMFLNVGFKWPRQVQKSLLLQLKVMTTLNILCLHLHDNDYG